MAWMDLDPFPWWLDTTSLVLAVVGVVLGLIAMPSAFQMMWGGPRITFEFDVHTVEGVEGRGLRCYIFNAPVRNRLLRACGVTRKEAYIDFSFSMKEVGTKRRTLGRCRYYSAGGQSTSTVLLKPTFMPEVLTLFVHTKAEGLEAQGPDAPNAPIPPGEYDVLVEVSASEQMITEKKRLVVGSEPAGTYWAAVDSS